MEKKLQLSKNSFIYLGMEKPFIRKVEIFSQISPVSYIAGIVSELNLCLATCIHQYSSVLKGNENSGNIGIENHKIHVIEHNLVVSGVNVSERKERVVVTCEDIHGNTISDGKPIRTMIVHTRTIGDRKYAMKETQDVDGKITDFKVLTEMSDIEKKFEED